MNKIEQMAIDMQGEIDYTIDYHYDDYAEVNIDYESSAKSLMKKGYGNIEQALTEFTEMLKVLYKGRAKEYTNWDGNKVQAVALDWLDADINETLKEFLGQ